MKFVLMPSLEHMALVNIVVSLWNQNDVRALILKLHPEDLYSKEIWKTIEERVIAKVLHLLLPQLLKEKVFAVIKPIGLELLGWMQYHDRYNTWIFDLHPTSLRIDLPVEFYWTPQGTVDWKRTAKVLVRNEDLGMSIRYKLACDNCLEGDIIQLWNSLPENIKHYRWINFPVIRFWSDNMKRGGVGPIPYKDAFLRSAVSHNKVAAEYFLQKLTPQEREELLVKAAKYLNADFLPLLLSALSEEEQMEVFKSPFYRCVLISFLQWPCQSVFVGVANRMWDLITKNDCYNILRHIIYKVRDGYKDCNYQKLFGEFWKESPSALKSLITNEIHKSVLITYLFDIKDKENIRLILKDATITVKEKLIYSDIMNYFCRRSILENDWNFLKFCIRECPPSENEMLKFKEKFEKHIMSCSFKQNFATKKHIWDQLFSPSDGFICKSDKRSVEGNSSSPKRFRSLQ